MLASVCRTSGLVQSGQAKTGAVVSFCCIGVQPVLVDDVPQVLKLGPEKLAFLWVRPEFGFVQLLKYLLECLHMLLQHFGAYNDVIQVGEGAWSHVRRDYSVQESLECWCRSVQPKRHDLQFEEPLS